MSILCYKCEFQHQEKCTGNCPRRINPAIKIVLVYSLFGGLWITTSDQILSYLIDDLALLTELQMYKGWFFIFFTSIMLFKLVAKYQRETKNQNEVFKRFCENSALGVYRTDLEGNILYSNPVANKIFGELDSEDLNLLKTYFSDSERLAKIESSVPGDIIVVEEKIVNEFDDVLYIKDTYKIMTSVDGKSIYVDGTIEDVTVSKTASLKLEAAREEAEKADRMKTEFLAQMSHEIRTPINSILNFTSLVKMETADFESETLSEYYEVIDRASKRLIRTIDLILNLAQLQTSSYTSTFKAVDLKDEVIKPLFDEFVVQAEQKGLKMIINSDTDDSEVNIDIYSVVQIFQNILDNALKYTNEGQIQINLEKDDSDNLVVSIEDTGVGMSDEYLAKIWEPFSQEEQGYTRSFDGNGLGLSLVDQYCKINDAEIDIKSEKNIGTKVSVIFPRLVKMDVNH